MMAMMVGMFLYNLYIFLPWNSMSISETSSILNNFFLMNNKMNFQSMYMYMYNKNIPTIIAMIYLLMSLTFIVKLCIKKKFSLRKMI